MFLHRLCWPLDMLHLVENLSKIGHMVQIMAFTYKWSKPAVHFGLFTWRISHVTQVLLAKLQKVAARKHIWRFLDMSNTLYKLSVNNEGASGTCSSAKSLQVRHQILRYL